MIFKTYVINGTAESGKDQFIEFIRQTLKEMKLPQETFVFNNSTVDSIRDFLSNLGLKEKTQEWRNAMGNIKNSCEKIDSDVFNRECFRFVQERNLFKNKNQIKINFIHCREPHNIERIKNMFHDINWHCQTILIRRYDVDGKFNNDKDSLDFISSYNYDYVLTNTELEMFKKKAQIFTETEILL